MREGIGSMTVSECETPCSSKVCTCIHACASAHAAANMATPASTTGEETTRGCLACKCVGGGAQSGDVNRSKFVLVD